MVCLLRLVFYVHIDKCRWVDCGGGLLEWEGGMRSGGLSRWYGMWCLDVWVSDDCWGVAELRIVQ